MDFTGSTPIALPGLVNGNILAIKLGSASQGNNYWAILGVERASCAPGPNGTLGDITYFGNCLLYVIGDQTLAWKRMVIPYEGKLITCAQLAVIPRPPYYTQYRLQPQPDGPTTQPVMETSGLLMLNVDWDPMNKFYITFKGDWCPLFRQP